MNTTTYNLLYRLSRVAEWVWLAVLVALRAMA
jgi:hypothetical protein